MISVRKFLTMLFRMLQANWLKSEGVRKGDCVAIYLPMVCELPIAMLACARIGAIHNVVFAGFSAEALAQRIQDCKYVRSFLCPLIYPPTSLPFGMICA